MLKALLNVRPRFANVKLARVSQAELCQELVRFEEQLITQSYKFGVLYVKHGQRDENEMFRNTETSPQFEEFLEWIGDKIVLKNWPHFRGGLDVKNDTTGTHSIYTRHRNMEIMFHVAPMLPFVEQDEQQLERKRHLGNDVVVIIFSESEEPFHPLTLCSHFNHIFVVVSVDNFMTDKMQQTYYKMAFSCLEGVRPFHPFLTYPPIFPKNEKTRDFFLTKLINAERSAMYAPAFATKMTRTREALLSHVLRKLNLS